MKWAVGIDEVGRGCLAGPVMVGVFAIQMGEVRLLEGQGVVDSKAISAARRNDVFEYLDRLARGGYARYAVAMQPVTVIDQIGIVGAIRQCIAEGLTAVDLAPAQVHVYLDGGLCAPIEWNHQSTHIKGDRDYLVISAASIVAKVLRDEYMTHLSEQFPEYSWDKNKGYGTSVHRNAIHQYGMTTEHRRLFCRNTLLSSEM